MSDICRIVVVLIVNFNYFSILSLIKVAQINHWNDSQFLVESFGILLDFGCRLELLFELAQIRC